MNQPNEREKKIEYIKGQERHWAMQGLRNSLYYGDIEDYDDKAINDIYNDFKLLQKGYIK